ncbi:MAG: tRNA uridine-5-carboxymethylaminomethyl(34) synthesis enzyme MnmG [Oscillospiraceae bacterium]|nr:tRNA uridine-5-carboxymethylaminomethyl(34) synthesis enzyme MnmG [Oscillospiraceae bacterium]
MSVFFAGAYDIAVIGGGHAGIEAALAGTRLGCRVICFSTQLDAIGNMPCNPSVGGTAKGHLVREIDALGGEMGRAADACCIQYRMLNRGKGPAVHSLRAQADRLAYRAYMKRVLEQQENLSLHQAEIADIKLSHNGAVSSVITALGGEFFVKAVILATGTFLGGRVITGNHFFLGGPDGLAGAYALPEVLRRLGIPLRRFKTGTPPRVLGRTLNRDKMQIQQGEDTIQFSFEATGTVRNQACCWHTWTTPETHEILRRNLDKSPLYSGLIEGTGPRYCPSIEDKIVRFADKDRHPIFCEPMGVDDGEYYLQGLSSSMPLDVQLEVIRSVPGLENAEMTRPGYAIEYDCLDPLCLSPSLETKKIPGLFGAGQVCGSSGYEEAAALGLCAGINAALGVLGRKPLVLGRSTSYAGTLIDDLVTKGTDEPYRMMTSRSEYRLLLRQDNADIRLTPIGAEIGLISQERLQKTLDKYHRINTAIKRAEGLVLPPSQSLSHILKKAGSPIPVSGIRMADLLRRPELTWERLSSLDPEAPELNAQEWESVEICIKYQGYLSRQQSQAEAFGRMESRRIPGDLNYDDISGLRLEARQKLGVVRPRNLGQAGRISGVSPADLTVLMIYLEK